MKPLVILILTCLPLATLTALSFVELASADGQGGLADGAHGRNEVMDTVADLRPQIEAEKPPAKGLSDADLFGPEPIPALESTPAASSLKAVVASWRQWLRARAMVGGVLEAEQMAEGKDVEQLKEAAAQFTTLTEKYGPSPPPGSRQLLALLERRASEMKSRITRRKGEIEAHRVLAQARSAFGSKKYDECAALCDQILTKFAEAVDASVLAKVRVLRDRAQFWSDADRMTREHGASDTPEHRKKALEAFCDRYPGHSERTEAEIRFLEKCKTELQQAKEQVAAGQRSESGMRLVRELAERPPAGFDARIERANRILRQTPEPAVAAALRGNVIAWVKERLPEKRINEPPELQEGRTREHGLVRGFFKEVKNADGALVGYKRYPTLEQMRNPVAEVGTYRVEEWSEPPGISLPRRCVTEYNEARGRLLDGPARKELWTGLAAVCEKLDAELLAYRRLPGASDEPFTFAAEAKFARETAGSAVWDSLQKVLAP